MSDVTGVILCGGKGERLRPYTDHMPKPLLPLNGHPILWYLLRLLSDQGVNRLVLCTGYKAECIEEFVRTQCDPTWDIECVNTGDASITDRLRSVWPLVKGRALICYGDTLANVALPRLLKRHEKSGAQATMTLYRPQNSFGVVKFDRQRRIHSFMEKPKMPQWINIGFILCEAEPVGEVLFQSEDMVDFLSRLAASGKLIAYEHDGKHLTINTEKERRDAEIEVVDFISVLDSY